MFLSEDRIGRSENPHELSTARLFQSSALADTERQALATAFDDIRTVDANDDIVRPGERTHALHFLLDGWAARYMLMKDGSRCISALMVPGDVCDLDFLMFDRVDYGVKSLTACRIAALPRQRVQELIAGFPRIGTAFMSLALIENAILREWAASVGRRSSRQRLARLLCELLERMKAVGKARGDSFEMPLTQEQLGDATGLTAVHVNRTLRSLQVEGLVDIKGRRATIHDWAKLKAMSGFRPDYLRLDELKDDLIGG